jgi:rod shape determining protein RodA
LASLAKVAETNFEALYFLGLASLILIHFVIHIGINLGLLPATGITLSFMSYGGSHLITSYAALGLAAAMSRRERYTATKELGFVD